ncbi:hypothetical protein ACFVYC_11040 [Pseudarthrobacter sp. NPDC058329]|uniref:hypothetical protein n=1 Tax=Pseudarthrobacter sp. NPDC058329 TaxID=3346448 RepID=UPI0036DF600C
MALSPWEPEESAASMIQTISAAHPVQREVAPLFLHYGLVFLSISVLQLLPVVRHRAVLWGQIPGLIGVYVGLPLFLLVLWRNHVIPWWPVAAVAAFIIASLVLPAQRCAVRPGRPAP